MTFETEVAADTPYIWWDTRQASGSAQPDRSGNSRTGTITGSPTLDATNGITFDNTSTGDDEYITSTGTFNGLNPSTFAFELVLYIASLPAGNGMLLFDDAIGDEASGLIIRTDGNIGLFWYDASTQGGANGSTPLTTATLHHVVGEYDGTHLNMYVDGASIYSAGGSPGALHLTRALSFLMADDAESAGDGFSGRIMHGIFYTHSLGATRVAAHFAALSDLTIDAPLLDASATLNAPSIGQPTSPAGTSPAPYVVKVVDIFGGNATTLVSALPAEIVWTLNEPTEATISFPKQAYSKTDVPTLATPSAMREIQIYRDGDIMFWGAMIGPDAAGSRGDVTCHCVDALWYCYRRNIDEPRVNFLQNADFESGTTHWTANGGITFTADTTRKVLGSHSAKLANLTAGGDTQIRQNFTAGPNGVGLLLTCAGWFFLESITAPAFGSIGLYLAGGRGGAIEDYNFYAIDTATPTNVWTRVEFTVWIPPNQVWDMQCKAFAPEGVIYWDALQVVAMDSIGSGNVTGSPTAEADIARITRVLVNHVQSTAAGKSNLNVGNHCPDTGVTLFRQYQFAEHISFQDALGEFVKRDDGFDISLEITPTTRTFETFYPTKGTDRTAAVTLTYGGNVADYRFSKDGAGAITRATTFGQGDGPDREEGEYVDTSQLGGLVLQEVRAAEQGATINSLLPTSRERVRLRKKPPLLLELDIRPSANLIHTLKVGDTVDVEVSDGYATVSGHHRIVKLKLDCKTNVLTAFVNEELT